MLAAFAEAARALERDDYAQVAERNAEFLLGELRQESGRLLRTWKARPACPEGYRGELAEGAGEAKLNGYLEDYAHLIEGLLELYQTTFEARWFLAAQELAETMINHFSNPEGAFYDTSDDHEALITRPRDLQDNATPSGNAMAVTALLKLAGFTNDLRYVDIAHQALAQMQPPTGGGMMSQYPLGFGQWLQALSYTLSNPREIAIVGDPDSADTQALLNVVRDGYQPFQVVALRSPDRLQLVRRRQLPSNTADGIGSIAAVPLLQDRGLVDGRATTYVCRSFSCRAPATDVEALWVLLENG
jgi:uncharacterized protein YyaL (SSP411 family)